MTLLGVGIYSTLREAKGLKAISLEPETGEKKGHFPQLKEFSAYTNERSCVQFLSLTMSIFPKSIPSGSHFNLDTDGFVTSNIKKSKQIFFNTKLISLGIWEQV